MKKMILLFGSIFALALLITTPVYAINFGMYKTETEYGLIDGFKWNIVGRQKGQPLVQLKSETEEEKIRIEKNKDKPKEQIDEVQMYKFMVDDTVVF